MSARPRIAGARALPAASLALALVLCSLSGQALAASVDCPALFDLYRSCNAQGAKVDSGKACLEDRAEAMTRALAQSLALSPRKNPRSARALVELVCDTGCDDALAQRPAATRLEFFEAFCD